ncbi:MAG: hypothetical protein H6737_16460 [Alphaproteobacteria bacterium]|nr:hypothetical protein [Alphaproteobacteria bacterium]
MILALLALTASADDEVVKNRTFVRKPVAGRPVFDLRIGAQSIDGRHPYMCGEGNPLAWLSIEACGTGAGIFHQSPGYDMAHFRTRVRALHGETGRADLDLLVGAGFAEVQSTTDQAGFRFGRQPEGAVEAAGAEGSVSVKGRFFTTPGTYLVADVNAGAAVIPGAPQVFGRGGPVVPFATATVGLGF